MFLSIPLIDFIFSGFLIILIYKQLLFDREYFHFYKFPASPEMIRINKPTVPAIITI